MADKDNLKLELLLQGCREGRRGSQRKLYELFYGYGMNICLRYGKNETEAQEMLNDGFLRVFTRLHQYDSDYPFKSWLRKVLINSAIDYHRKHKRHQLSIATEDIGRLVEERQELTDLQAGEDLMVYVQQLPPAYRMVFNLYVMEGYKHHEIAEQLNISVGSSKSNLSRAKEKLRRLLIKNRRKKTGR
ncbi:MAG: RNA polymerase sigma factor [Saprospiraceae bacterium]|nr:RNA polymerase sigma factor [Saprospiraceae bacterium]